MYLLYIFMITCDLFILFYFQIELSAHCDHYTKMMKKKNIIKLVSKLILFVLIAILWVMYILKQ